MSSNELYHFKIPQTKKKRKRKDEQTFGSCQGVEKGGVREDGGGGALGTIPKAWNRDWGNWRSEGESRPSRPQQC